MRDPVSSGNYADVYIEHLDAFWRVDFHTKNLNGYVTLSVRLLRDDVEDLVRNRWTFQNILET